MSGACLARATRSLCCVIILGIILVPFPARAEPTCEKIPEDALLLEVRGVIDGYPGGLLGLDRVLTRAEGAKIVSEILKISSSGVIRDLGSSAFRDVPSVHWASKYITFAWENGIVRGYADGTFRPEKPVSVAEMGVMIARMYVGYLASVRVEYDSQETSGIVPQWAVPEIWAVKEVVETLRSCGLLQRNLDRPMLRSEVITLVYKFMERVGLLFDVEGQIVSSYGKGRALEVQNGAAEVRIPIASSLICIVGTEISEDVSWLRTGDIVHVILNSRGEATCIVSY